MRKAVQQECPVHGLTNFRLEKDHHGKDRFYYRCSKCRYEQQKKIRWRYKEKLVQEAGGKCHQCGYSRCLKALQFHHLDRGMKSFTIGTDIQRPLAVLRAEAAKCVLLCVLCHVELEAGLITLR